MKASRYGPTSRVGSRGESELASPSQERTGDKEEEHAPVPPPGDDGADAKQVGLGASWEGDED